MSDILRNEKLIKAEWPISSDNALEAVVRNAQYFGFGYLLESDEAGWWDLGTDSLK